MSRRVALTTINARSIDIINTIRQNASAEYQSLVPQITKELDIPKVGEVLYGYPNLANQFLNALMNRIALVRIKSATFNNAYANLKKGYLEFGETVEEVFVGIAKAREFSAEKAESREFKRTIPDVRSAFHIMNWRVQYPVTIQQEDLRTAFTSANGVTDMIAKIVDSIYTGAEYDEFLLFKYLLIKAIAHGKMYPVTFDATDLKNGAKKFRGMSNSLTFMSTKYNASGVHTTTPKADQNIFMDATFNAEYDVDVLASAFNMDKATFSGKLQLIDDFTHFDNARFEEIRKDCDMIEEVTSAELALMADVKAVLVDTEWFQIYDNNSIMTETYVGSGLYWNYFYNVWKTVSSSPFSNAIVFLDDGADVTLPSSFTVEVTDKSVAGEATVLTLAPQSDDANVEGRNYLFKQTKDAVEAGVAVHKYGALMFPPNADSVYAEFIINGITYRSSTKVGTSADVGDTFTFAQADTFANDISITGVTLSPDFASGTDTYTGATTSATGKISVELTDPLATYVVKMNGTAITGDTLTFTSGSGNVVTVVVTSAVSASTTKTYTITVTKS